MIPYKPRTSSDRQVSIGVMLRGQQSEYGVEKCLSEKTKNTIRQVADTIIAERGGRLIEIENHLSRSGLTPTEIEAQYSQCDLIISSRFHGAILAARHGIPFIAIDQIAGGAKVSALLGETGWQYIFRIDNTDTHTLIQSARELLTGKHNAELLKVRDGAIQGANVTLTYLDDLILHSNKC